MKHWLKQNRGFIVFLLCFGFFRTAIADWNPIPSGSMRPTLLEGDVVLVNRIAYDLKLPLTNIRLVELGTPQRGDIVTFNRPGDGERLIKRLIGLPGDSIEMRNEQLYINGQRVSYEITAKVSEPIGDHEQTTLAIRATEHLPQDSSQYRDHIVQFLPEVSARRNFGPLVVPADQYFFLGDNRDNSADSRYFGFVPRELLIGKAHHLLLSVDIKGNWLPRGERFGEKIG
jgi:signal peptidase I